jgi:hypothetical protein
VIWPASLFPNIVRLATLRPRCRGKLAKGDEPRSSRMLIELEFGGMGV